jgi:hypothetical protein
VRRRAGAGSQVAGGEFVGRTGLAMQPACRRPPAGDVLEPGPPGAYLVSLDRPDSAAVHLERILATDLAAASSRAQPGPAPPSLAGAVAFVSVLLLRQSGEGHSWAPGFAAAR